MSMTEPTETAETAPAVARRPVALGVTFTVLLYALVGYPLGLAVTAMIWEVGSGFFGFGINAQPLVDLFISGFSLGYISVFYGAGLVMIVVGVIVGAPLAALVERWLERNRVLDAAVPELKKGMESVEGRARHELGMVKEGGTLCQLAQ